MTWKTTRLKHLCIDAGQYGLGVSANEYVASGHRLLRTTDIDEAGHLRSRDNAVFVDVHLDQRHELKAGDLLLTRSGATVGRSMLVGHLEEPSTFAAYLVRFRPLRRTDPRFLAYVAVSRGFQEAIKSDAVVSTIQNFNAERYANISVVAPPLDEQRHIADFLDAETAQIERLTSLRTSQMETLTAHYQSHLSEMALALCGRYGTVKVRHVLQNIEQGWSPQCEERPCKEGEWGVVKAGCVNGGVFDATQHKALPSGTPPERRYRLRAGDLLMSRASGSVELIGSIAVLPKDLPDRLLLCDKIYRLRMDRIRMSPLFVAFMLRTFQVREQIKLGISGAEGMANNLPTATVTNLPLPDVPLSEQARIVNDLNDAWRAVQETRQKLREQLNILAERRQALITAAVTGGITV